MNNYTAMISINDDQGGDRYAFEVTWRSEGDRPNAPAPFFDDVRACRDSVRQRFLSRNDRCADIDGFPNRQNKDQGTHPGPWRRNERGRLKQGTFIYDR
jgi:hypothetical protein